MAILAKSIREVNGLDKELMLIEYVPELAMYRALNSFVFMGNQYRPGDIISRIDIIAYLRGDRVG